MNVADSKDVWVIKNENDEYFSDKYSQNSPWNLKYGCEKCWVKHCNESMFFSNESEAVNHISAYELNAKPQRIRVVYYE